ncbi:hypothetical protein HOLleu_32035 [Holothuria leucospilota]|uniref:Uncharacterized protein n=1 Tax=Holothuria leucospilota TaxID=206669 RepID=A0A9Q1BGP1_HOLLE|nr:hypothetical protein HOLleu_32035 [Holothuria leucospilota]
MAMPPQTVVFTGDLGFEDMILLNVSFRNFPVKFKGRPVSIFCSSAFIPLHNKYKHRYNN